METSTVHKLTHDFLLLDDDELSSESDSGSEGDEERGRGGEGGMRRRNSNVDQVGWGREPASFLPCLVDGLMEVGLEPHVSRSVHHQHPIRNSPRRGTPSRTASSRSISRTRPRAWTR